MLRSEVVLKPAFVLVGVRGDDGKVYVYSARGYAKDDGDIIDATITDESQYDDLSTWGSNGVLARIRTHHEYELKVRLSKFTWTQGTSFGDVFGRLFGVWSAARTWVAGEVVTAARLNESIRDGIKRLKGGSIA